MSEVEVRNDNTNSRRVASDSAAPDQLASNRYPTLGDVRNATSRPTNALDSFPSESSLLQSLSSGDRNNSIRSSMPLEYREQINATNQLNDRLPSMNPYDRRTMQNLHWAVASGDSEAFAQAIKRFGNDPHGLQNMIGMLDQNLQDTGSGLRATVNKAGDRVTIVGQGGHAMDISTDGRASVREVTHFKNGTYRLGQHVHNANPLATMVEMGEQARQSILYGGRSSGSIGRNYPFQH